MYFEQIIVERTECEQNGVFRDDDMENGGCYNWTKIGRGKSKFRGTILNNFQICRNNFDEITVKRSRSFVLTVNSFME